MRYRKIRKIVGENHLNFCNPETPLIYIVYRQTNFLSLFGERCIPYMKSVTNHSHSVFYSLIKWKYSTHIYTTTFILQGPIRLIYIIDTFNDIYGIGYTCPFWVLMFVSVINEGKNIRKSQHIVDQGSETY